MLSEEFVAGRVFEGDARRAEQERELMRRRREQRAERRAEHAARRGARSLRRHAAPVATEAAATPIAPAAEQMRQPVGQEVAEPQRELAHAGR